MGETRLRFCGLALLVVCGGAFARPAAETAQARSGTAWDAVLATCPYTIHGNATAQQAQGVWFVLEALHPSVAFEAAGERPSLPCVRCNFTFESAGRSLSVAMEMVRAAGASVGAADGEETQQTWTYNLAPSGMWENAASFASMHLGVSADGQLLLVCSTDGGEAEVALALARSPHVDAGAVEAARSPLSSGALVIRPELEHCEALQTATNALPSPHN